MEITKDIRKELYSFELSELERLLEAIEEHEYYASGLSNLSGTYVNATAEELEEGEDYDDDKEAWVDSLVIGIESGENDETCIRSLKTRHRISRKYLGNKTMSLKEKLSKVEEA
jgi:hypothetical protein